MHFASQNLLSIMHQAMNSQHVTVAFFKRYARTPETRAFKYYFRLIGPGGLPGCNFIPYMRRRAHYSLNRYITLHKHKGNLILKGYSSRIWDMVLSNRQQNGNVSDFTHVPSSCFKKIKTTILELLQQRITVTPENYKPKSTPQKPLKTQNKPNLCKSKITQVILPNRLKTKDYGLETEKNKPNRTQLLQPHGHGPPNNGLKTNTFIARNNSESGQSLLQNPAYVNGDWQ